MKTERGGGRPGLRIALAAVLFFDVWFLLGHHFLEPPELEQPEYWPQFFYAISQTPWLLWAIAACAMGSIGLFAARKWPIASGFAAVLFVGLLNEAYTSTVQSPRRMFFTAGATLIGWLAGLVVAKLLNRDDQAAERLAESGAVAGLAATFAGAATQKLMVGGLFGSTAMRAIILSHAPYSGGVRELVRTIGENGFVMEALSAATVAIQLGGILMIFGGRLRVFAGLGLIGFHLGTLLMLDIIYVESTFLLVALTFPWHRLRRAESPLVPVETISMKAAAGLLAGLVALTALGAIVPTSRVVGPAVMGHWANEDRPAGFQDDPPGSSDSQAIGEEPLPQVVSVGPFNTGSFFGGWQCVHLLPEPPRLVATFERGADVAVFEIRLRQSGDGPQPLNLPGLHITPTYQVGDGPFEEVEAAVQGAIRSASDDPVRDFPRWLEERELDR